MAVQSVFYAFMALVAQSAPSSSPADHLAAADQVKACGFAHVRLKYNRGLGENVVEVFDTSSASDESLRCAASVSVSTATFVAFPEALSKEYDRLYAPLSFKHAQDVGRARLAQRGLLDKLPRYEKGNDLAYARRLELLCGPSARGAFSLYHGYVLLNAETPHHGVLDNDTFGCLLDAMWASGMPPGPGFVGNEPK